MNILQKRQMTKKFIELKEIPQDADPMNLKIAVDSL